ncbi:type II 3-dehydroquinate dehydratase [Corynebacterium halotolerans]|uniref:type II 3-dehydroquinate dehydratase n=1 Tax=Corynebacterium halotolerans TaxID=225326 RepID=UPI003CFACD70
MKVLVINGPNLNRLGKRQPEVYGSTSLADVTGMIEDHATRVGLTVECRQSNAEADLLDWAHEAADEDWAVIVNPGGFTHTSVALRDALAEVAEKRGFVEVHISNVHAREEFRQHSYLSPLAKGVVAGLGIQGYIAALDYFAAS